MQEPNSDDYVSEAPQNGGACDNTHNRSKRLKRSVQNQNTEPFGPEVTGNESGKSHNGALHGRVNDTEGYPTRNIFAVLLTRLVTRTQGNVDKG